MITACCLLSNTTVRKNNKPWLTEKVATKYLYESSNPRRLSATLLLALPGARNLPVSSQHTSTTCKLS